MAATKKTETEPEQVLETEGTETYDPWKDMRDVYLPRARTGDEQSLFVSVNDYTALLPYGKKSTVPLPVYEVIMHGQEAEERLAESLNNVPNKG